MDLNFAGVPVFLNPNGSKFSNLNFAVGPGGESSTTGESSTSESYTNRANTTEQEKLKKLIKPRKKTPPKDPSNVSGLPPVIPREELNNLLDVDTQYLDLYDETQK